ncbi:MAG: hypothetical protein ACRETB_10055 [Steroidobacteraceae bacterium]
MSGRARTGRAALLASLALVGFGAACCAAQAALPGPAARGAHSVQAAPVSQAVLGAGPSAGYSTWIVARAAQTVTLRLTLPVAAAQRLSGTDIPVLTVSKLGSYVLAHTAVEAAGRDCPASDQGYDLGRVDPLDAGVGLYGFEIVFRCARPLTGLVLEDHVLFGRAPSHVDFARIEVGRQFSHELFTAGHERFAIPDAGAPPSASSGRYLRLGWRHLFGSPLRLAFLAVALLLVRRPRDLAALLGGAAGGYVLSFLAQAAGGVEPRMVLVEGFIGLLTVLLALRLALPSMTRPELARTGWSVLLVLLAVVAALLRTPQAALLLLGGAGFSVGYLRVPGAGGRVGPLLLPACLYAFVDGFALPALLAPEPLAGWTRAPMVAGYDAGALLAACALTALAVAAALALLRVGFLEVIRPALSEIGATCLAGLGTFWLVASAGRTIPATLPGKIAPSVTQTLATVDRTRLDPDTLLMRKYMLQGNTLVLRTNNPDE